MDKKIDVVETDIWEPGEKPHMLRYVGQRKALDVFQDLKSYLEQRDMLPDEYFLPSHSFDKNSLFPKDVEIIAFSDFGGSEGIYLDVDLFCEAGRVHFATGKTLDETKEALDRMYLICSAIILAFHGDTNVHARYFVVADPDKSDSNLPSDIAKNSDGQE